MPQILASHERSDSTYGAPRILGDLECELLNRRRFRTQVEARHAIFRFIEGWYNPHRRHSALGNRSPISYEKLITEAA